MVKLLGRDRELAVLRGLLDGIHARRPRLGEAGTGLSPQGLSRRAPGTPLFQAAAASLNLWTEAKVDSKNPARGPLLIISGEKDHTVPWAIANASFRRQRGNEGVTEIVEIPNRGHALTIDSGWQEVAATALAFVQRFVPPAAPRAALALQAKPLAKRGGTRGGWPSILRHRSPPRVAVPAGAPASSSVLGKDATTCSKFDEPKTSTT